MKKSCSIVIPTKDKLSRLALTLKCLEPQVTEDVQVIVVFDGCKEETIEGFSNLNLSYEIDPIISEKNVGRAAARNLGIAEAIGDVIIFLDDDRLTERDFINKHLSYHEEEPCVVLGERMDLKYSEEAILNLAGEETIEKTLSEIQKGAHKEFYYNIKKWFLRKPRHALRYIAFITGNVSIDTCLIKQLGGFDESFKGWGYEDTDLGYRLAKENVKYIADYSIICYHMLHSHVRGQKSNEELKNLDYFKAKFPRDKTLQKVIGLYTIKANLRL